ncbi:endonuclease MutS2 [Pontibacillus salicampi]|uniref:Endonuclease MutS2 n=1 Tax=Pontibacillus salicampi TaxID=1449801 RepID=A0ABV6LT91_9BACI
MNIHAYQALQCEWILNEVARFAKTNKGIDTIQNLRPTVHRRQIERMLEEVQEAERILSISSSVPIHSLDTVTDTLEQAKKGMFIRADQFEKLTAFLDHCGKLKRFMRDKGYAAPTISTYVDSIADLSDLEAEIQSCFRHGRVDDYASKELQRLRKQTQQLLTKMKERMNTLSKSKKLSAFVQERVVAEKNGRFVIPVKASYRNKMKGTVIDSSASGATVFIEPEEITNMQEELQLLRIAEEREVEQILYYLTSMVLEKEHELYVAMETMHQYDVIFAKAHYSKSINAHPAEVNDTYTIQLKNARHPMLGEEAVPLNIHLTPDHYALVITGPNTGGKTVTLKTVGLLTFMTQVGLPIPAEEGSSLHLFHDIFVDIGDGQSITENLSTFSSRLKNIISILQEANDHSLVLLDELGSGTDPTEGMGLATAILDQLYEKGCTIFATTHYNEMKDFAEQKEGFVNGSMEFDLETLQPTYRLLLDTTGKSQAFQIALKLGMHPGILEKAHEISYKEKASYRSGIEAINDKQLVKQVSGNRYARQSAKKPSVKHEERIPVYSMGDNVTVLATGETGIIYKGPDSKGNYIVQIKGEKQTLNHKRIQLHIRAEDLYPEDYDFDIIFKSKEYRKIRKQIDRKHVEGISLEEED